MSLTYKTVAERNARKTDCFVNLSVLCPSSFGYLTVEGRGGVIAKIFPFMKKKTNINKKKSSHLFKKTIKPAFLLFKRAHSLFFNRYVPFVSNTSLPSTVNYPSRFAVRYLSKWRTTLKSQCKRKFMSKK